MANDIDGLLAENQRMREALEVAKFALFEELAAYDPPIEHVKHAAEVVDVVLSAAPQPPTADAIAKAIAKAVAAERTGWQPIETAPKDGTLILAFRPLARKTHDPVIKIVMSTSRDNGCWDVTVPEGFDGTNFTDGYCKPTHWMPIPAAPATEAARQEGGAA